GVRTRARRLGKATATTPVNGYHLLRLRQLTRGPFRNLTSPTEFRACVFSTLSHSRIRIYDHFSLDIAGPQLYTEAQSIEGVASAMRYIEDPRQERLFDRYHGLFPPLARRILENGWQGTFRLAILETLPVGKLSEHFHPSLGTHTKELYSMAGLVFLADFHGWTTQQAIEAYMFHTDVQFALNVEPGVQVCTRTLERYQELFREDDLAALTFKNVTEALVEKLEQDVSLQRLDSTHLYSHMATFGRTKLMAVAIKRFLVQVKRHNPDAYAALPEPLRLRYELAQSQLFGNATDAEARQRSRQQAAEDLLWVIEHFADQPTMTGRQSYKALLTIFSQQCEVIEGKVTVRAKTGGNCMQNPSDAEATYDGHKGPGYQAQIAETCSSENEVQLITAALPQTACEPDEGSVVPMLDQLEKGNLLPEEMLADTLYTNDENVQAAAEFGVDMIGPVPGRAPEGNDDALTVDDFAVDERTGIVGASGLTHHFSQRFQGSEPVQSTSTRFSTPPGGGDGGCSFLYFFSRPEQEPTPLSPPGKVLRTN